MKLFRNGKHVKTVRKEFEPVLYGYNFKSSGKRLSAEERDELGIRLTSLRYQNYLKSRGYQGEFALERFDPENFDVVFVRRKFELDRYEIRSGGVGARVESGVIEFYPESLIKN